MGQENYSDAQLDNILGTDSRQFTSYRTISIDNGTDIVGTGATGAFIEKSWDEAKKEAVRTLYAPEFKGIILAAKAQLVNKGKTQLVRTEEFDPGEVNEPMKIFPISEGKMIKDPKTQQIRFTTATYKQIQSRKLLPCWTMGGVEMKEYNYFIILYVGVGEEILKLKFKGAGRGNFFAYSKQIQSLGAKIYNVMTEFSTYIDKEVGKYTVSFDYEKDAKGYPITVNPDEVRTLRVQLAQGFQQMKSIGAPKQDQLTAPNPGDEVPAEMPEDDDEDEVKIEDVPV